MNGDVDWTLLAKHLFGECSKEEAGRIQAWIEEDSTREALLEEMRQVFQMTGASPASESWDTTALWDRIQQQTQSGKGGEALAEPGGDFSAHAPDRLPRRGRMYPRSDRSQAGPSFMGRMAWAGVFALVVATLATLWLHGVDLWQGAMPLASETKTFATQKGQRASIRLADGTRVRLNVDSRLTVPVSFGEGERTVQLEGEAFFEVKEDATRPFNVHTEEAVTRVLGTVFDVSAYPGEDETKVVVTEGRVAVRAGAPSRSADPSASEGTTRDLVLTKQQMGQIRRSGQVMRRDLAASHQHLAWMEGQLVFEKARFDEVARKLERWYGITVALGSDTAAPSGRLNARFAEDQPLHEVLSVVATAYGLEYERHEQRVLFIRAGDNKTRSP